MGIDEVIPTTDFAERDSEWSAELPERAFWVAFHRVPYIGPARLRRLLETFGSLERAWHAGPTELRRCLEERPVNELVKTRNDLDLPELMASLERSGARMWQRQWMRVTQRC